ncbi:hypothetical protein JCM16303_000054 [Sporobolomyces ruberrimus]
MDDLDGESYDSDASEPEDARTVARRNKYDFESFKKYKSGLARRIEKRKKNIEKRDSTSGAGDGLQIAFCGLLKTLIGRLALLKKDQWNSHLNSDVGLSHSAWRLPGKICGELDDMTFDLKHNATSDRIIGDFMRISKLLDDAGVGQHPFSGLRHALEMYSRRLSSSPRLRRSTPLYTRLDAALKPLLEQLERIHTGTWAILEQMHAPVAAKLRKLLQKMESDVGSGERLLYAYRIKEQTWHIGAYLDFASNPSSATEPTANSGSRPLFSQFGTLRHEFVTYAHNTFPKPSKSISPYLDRTVEGLEKMGENTWNELVTHVPSWDPTGTLTSAHLFRDVLHDYVCRSRASAWAISDAVHESEEVAGYRPGPEKLTGDVARECDEDLRIILHVAKSELRHQRFTVRSRHSSLSPASTSAGSPSRLTFRPTPTWNELFN